MNQLDEFLSLMGRRDLPGARRLAEEALSWPDNKHLAHYMQALVFYEEHNWSGAESELLACLQIQPGFASALHTMGNVCVKTERPADAARCFEAALRSDPNHFEARVNLGVMCAAQGQMDEAMAHFEQASRLCGNSADRHDDLAHKFGELGLLDRAKTHWLEASRLSPQWDQPLYNIGILYEKQRNWNEAENFYRQAVARSPKNPEYRRRLRTVMACADLTRFHLTRWSRNAIRIDGHDSTETVVYDRHDVPVVSARHAEEFKELAESMKALSQKQSPILFRGQWRSYTADGEVSVKPAGLRISRTTADLISDVEQWRDALRDFLGELTGDGLGLFGWGDLEKGTFLNPPGIKHTGNMLELAGQPELVGTMQHYGFPTDYLDVTPNADVALWFALRRADKGADGLLRHSPTMWTESTPLEEWPVVYVFLPERTQVVDLTDGCLSEAASPRAQRQHAVLLSFNVYYDNSLDDLARTAGVEWTAQVVPRAPDLGLIIRLSPDESWSKLSLPEPAWYFPSDDHIYRQLLAKGVRHVARYA